MEAGLSWFEIVRKPGSEPKTTRRQDDAIHGDSQSGQELGSRGSTGQGTLCCDGEVQRGVGKSRRDACRRGAATELEGQADQVFGTAAHGDRRPLRGNQGTDRRLLAVAGEVNGRGGRAGATRQATEESCKAVVAARP